MAVAVSACGSSDSTSSDTAASGTETSASNTSESGGGDTYLAKIDEEVEGFYEGSNFREPTESSPAAKGKDLYIIECGAQVTVCSFPAAAAEEAAKKLGWNTTVIDAKFNSANFAPSIETAIAGGADAIMVISIDCQLVKPQLEKAHKAGIVVGAQYAIDCKGDPQYDAPLVIGTDRDWTTQVSKYEEDRMKVIIGETDGEGKVLMYKQDDLVIMKVIREAAERALATCADCEIADDVTLALADTPNVIQQKTQDALSANPEANALFPLHDGQVLSGVAAGVQASGRADQVFLMGADGFPEDIELVRNGQQNAVLVFPAEWGAWAVVDAINRKFAGMGPQDSGISWQLIDAERNLPPEGQPWEPPVDFRQAYEKLWGLS